MGVLKHEGVEKSRIMLGLLELLEQDGTRSQRRLAADLGIALGLVNAYIRRCVKKGLLKIGEAPARRYAYYVTPKGFAEKSRLTVDYLSYSFSFFRQTKADCAEMLTVARSRGLTQIAIDGISDIAEIAAICAMDCGVKIVAVVDSRANVSHFCGVPVVASFDLAPGKIDAVLVANLASSAKSILSATERFGADRVLVPSILDRRRTVVEAI